MAIGAPTADQTPQDVSGETAAADTAASDRAKAQRILAAMPFDAAWLRFLQAQGPMRRVKVEYTQALGKALDDLLFDDVDFLDAELGRAHAAFKDSLGRLHTELDGMFTPDDGPAAPVYVEVPPEWKRTEPERYTQMMAALSGARDDFLEARAELVNALNRKGLLA